MKLKMDNVIIFIPYGSRLGFHTDGIASTMANIDYKFPQCICYEENNKDEQYKMHESVGRTEQAYHEH